MQQKKDKRLSRRHFVRTAAASAGAVLLSRRAEGQETAAAGKAAGFSTSRDPDTAPLTEGLTREQILELLDATAEYYMGVSHNCAQSSFLALQEVFGLEDGSIVKALTPFPGIAERGETCGAVTGTLMALGLVYGRDRLDDWEGWRKSLVPTREFCARFEDKIGSMSCGDILEKRLEKRLNLTDPEDLAEYRAAGGPTICTGVVQQAVRIAAAIILDNPHR
jgi:C_GCAxxG_C_C family probable redox protein